MELDLKNHTIVLLDKTNNSNLQKLNDDSHDFNLGFKNLISPNSLPSLLKNNMLKDKAKMGDNLGVLVIL